MNEHTTRTVFRTSQLELADGEGTNKTDNRTMGEIIAARFSRRGFLRGAMADGDDRRLLLGDRGAVIIVRVRSAALPGEGSLAGRPTG